MLQTLQILKQFLTDENVFEIQMEDIIGKGKKEEGSDSEYESDKKKDENNETKKKDGE
jgi:hypothetical protein